MGQGIRWDELGTDISVREAKRLLKDPNTNELPELSISVVRAFEVPDGRVLLVIPDALPEKEPVFAWHSRAHLERYNREKEPLQPGSRHVLDGRKCGRKDFIQQVPQLCVALPELLHLKESVLDLTVDSFIHIDRALRGVESAEILEEPLFSALCAYLGETLRRSEAGEFIAMQDPRESNILVPYLRVKNTLLNFILPFHDEIAETRQGERSLHRLALSLSGR